MICGLDDDVSEKELITWHSDATLVDIHYVRVTLANSLHGKYTASRTVFSSVAYPVNAAQMPLGGSSAPSGVLLQYYRLCK